MGIFGDIVALAKAGFTPADVKELMKMERESPEASPETPAEPEPEQDKEPAGSEPAAEPETGGGSDTAESEKIKELEKKLQAAQAAAQRAQRQPEQSQKTDADNIKDMARRFM